MIVKAITSFLMTYDNDEMQYALWRDYLAAALGPECYERLLGEGVASVRAIEDVGKRVYYFHTDAFFPDPAQAVEASLLPNDTFRGVFPLPAGSETQPVLKGSYLRPIIWFPFENEAFAFGAITTPDTFRLFGRMGALTRGYRVTDDGHWRIIANEPRPLTFAEDVDTTGSFKYAEFDAGPLPPGDLNIGLDLAANIRLYADRVPFYIGAMPLDEPTRLEFGRLTDLHLNTRFSYLEAVLDTPIIFDPMINCQACG
ncbi:MAG: hypothetical protein R3C44_24690 [Chloroflexota bacterium]